MKYLNFKLLMFFAALALAIPPAWAETKTIALFEQGWADKQNVSGVTSGDIAISFDWGTNTQNGPMYYTNGSGVRLYNNNTMTIAVNDNTITAIVLQFSATSYMGGFSANVGSYTTSDNYGNWNGSAQSVTFTASSTCRLQKITVTYGEGSGGDDPTPTDSKIYEMVTDRDKQMVEGKHYIFVCDNVAVGPLDSNGYGTEASVDVKSDGTVDISNSSAEVFTLEKNDYGYYTFKFSDNQYIIPKSASSSSGFNKASKDDNGWSLAVAGNGFGITSQLSTNSRGLIHRDGYTFRHYSKSNANSTGYGWAILYVEKDGGSTVERVATPTFSPAGGNFDAPQNVTISCETPNSTIYYTTNGDTPDETSTEYTGAITLSETTTIKAIAVAADMENSLVASATYTLPKFVSDFVTANGLADNTNFAYTKRVVVVYVKGSNMWIQDENATAGGGYVYTSGLNFAANDVIEANWKAKKETFSQFPEFTGFEGSKVVGDGNTQTPVALERSTLNIDNFAEYVLLKNVTISTNSDNLYVSLGRADYQLYTDKLGLNTTFAPEDGKTYNVKGIVGGYQGNLQIYPIEITEYVAPGNPSIEITAPETLPFNDEGGVYTVNASYLPDGGLGVSVSDGFSRYLINGHSDPNYYFDAPYTEGTGHTVTNGQTRVNYTGREFSATGTITYASQNATQSENLSYRSDVYIYGDFGNSNGWGYLDNEAMSYDGSKYTKTFTVDNKSFFIFARKTGESYNWDTNRLFFGAKTDGRNWVYTSNTTDDLDLNGIKNYGDDNNVQYHCIEIPAGEYTITIDPTTKKFTIEKVVHQVEKPVISPEGGEYNTIQTVTITCVDGATIHYTTNGDVPDENSSVYGEPITVDKTMTIKAIAVMNGMTNSEVAEATYTLPTSVNTLAAANALAAPTEFLFTGDAVVTYHNGDYTFLRDVNATAGGGLIYQSGINLAQGVVLKKGWDAKRADYRGEKEYINAINVESSGSTADYTPFNRTGVVFDDTHMNEYVTFNNVTITGKTLDEGSSKYTYTGTYSDDNRVTVNYTLHNQFDLTNIEEGRTYNVTGVVVKRDENMQVYPTAVTLVQQDPKLAYSAETATATFGVAPTNLPTLTKPDDLTVNYESSNTAVATVDENGNVAIVGVGTAIIKASNAENTYYLADEASYTLTVGKGDATMSFAKSEIEATYGDENVEANALTNEAGLTVTYSCEPATVATVDATTGVVTLVGAGTATITATGAANDNYNGATATYTLTVGKADPTVEYSAETATATFGAENNPLPTLTLDPTDLTVTYESTNTAVATVDAQGVVTIVGAGETTIKAKFAGNDNYNAAEDSYVLTVGKADPTVEYSAETATATFGAENNPLPTLTLDPTDLTVTYESTNTAVATVDAQGVVTIVGAGETTIKAKFSGNDNYNAAEDSYTLTVSAATPTFAYSAPTASAVFGETATLPTLSNPNSLTVTYTSSNPAVATVNEDGEVTIVGAGETVITATGAATGNYNGATATYMLTVGKAAAGLNFSAPEASAVVGSEFTAPALSNPNNLNITYSSSDENVATVAADGTVTIVGEGTTTITATYNSETGNYENGSATYTLTVAPQPVVATPVITPNGGSYSAAQPVNITCATEGATILYSTNGTNWTEGSSLTVSENCTVYAKATKAGSIDSQVAQATFKFEIPETPEGPMLKGYYQIKNNGNGEYVNVLGRKTLRFTTNPADQAGSVIYVETSDKNDGQVQSLRSQAADLQGYADRAMRYVPEVVQLVVNKLHAAGSGEVLGEHGYDEIMAAFNESFDYHLYVEQGDKGYRLYGKTPSMQPVVDFYRSHKDQVDAKLPMIEGFINEAIDKILQKTNGSGQSILVDYDIHEVWQRMGAENSGLTEPKDATSDLAFYQEVLNDKDNVWNFAYQSVMIYWEKLKNHPKFQAMKPQLGEFANYIDKLEQIRPNAKYYVIQTDGKPDYVSDGNALILNNEDCTYWTLEPRTEFTVNFPADTKYGDQYVTTLYTDFAYNVPEGVTAYKVTAVDEQGLAQIEALTSPIAAQTPVLLMAQANGRAEVAKTLTIVESGNAVDGNLLVGPDFLIERDSILTPQVAAVFALAKTYVSEDFYNNYVKQYEHLMFRNSGTVNNKYFWGISLDDLKNYCSYENNEGMKDCDVRSLGIADGKIAFSEHFTVATNKAFLINKDFDVINLAVVEKPVITPVPENPYTAPVEVTITCATEGATILYTTDGGEHWTEYTKPFTLNETTTVQAYATKAGLGDSEKTEEVEYVIELPVATPVVTPEGGSYGSAQTVKITCDTPEAVISYSTDGGKTWTEYTEPFTVDTDCTITVKAEKTGMTPSETSVSYVFEIPESPIEVPALKGYFYIKNNESDNCFANVLGRKTLHFTSAPEDQAGTVYYLETDGHGQVQSLRSQAADFQGYADRAMNYVPKVVQIVANKLNATGTGNILGEHGYDEIMAAFNASFDHHLYVEPTDKGENVYRLYAKTPSMQPVVDFYRSHKDQVDAKLPMLEGFINTAIHKILEKTDNVGAGILENYDIHKVWENMGGKNSGLTEPVDDATDLTFYQEVLNNKDNVWNFAYQSVMIYWNNLMNNETFQQYILPQLGNDAQYLENLTQIRPNTKYYVIKNGDELDYVSADHSYITGDAGKTYWTLDPRTTFDVNIPQELVYGNQYVTSLYTDFAYTLPEGVTAYKVSSISDKGVVDTEVLEGPIAAQTPVLLMANEAGVKTLTIAESGNAVEGNLLVGPDFLIERDSILTSQVAALFSFAKGILSDEFYENNVKQYEHLMFRTAGLVNNKYFWGISQDDLMKYCVYKNEDDEYDTDIRSLGVEKGSAAFCEHWTVETNKAFLIDETKEFETLVLRVRDITRDGKWDIADATALINILLEWPQILHADIWDYEAADFNHDGLTDIVDATDLIDYLLYK